MDTRELYAPAVEAAKKRWPITDQTRVTTLSPRFAGEALPIRGLPGGVATIEIEGVQLTPEWAGSYFEGWDELIIGRIRKREKWEMIEGEPDWIWDR